jgi:hypothetical protein
MIITFSQISPFEDESENSFFTRIYSSLLLYYFINFPFENDDHLLADGEKPG